MYKRILVALENGRADASLLPHVANLAGLLSSELILFHVADGFAARHFEQLKLAESDEIKEDRQYLLDRASELRARGLSVDVLLAFGNPPNEILRAAEQQQCDLIAMTTHGHRFLSDLIHGSTITAVRHKSQVPVLLVRATEV
jgi:nucleotide-binding universal stress UspA family protein